jgi:para-aminobenzoate synthetase component I
MFVQELPLAPGSVALACRLADAPGFAWLDSDGSGLPDARYSFLSAGPVEVRRSAAGTPQAFEMFDALHVPEAGSGGRADLKALQPDPSAIPYWIGYMAYDAFAANARIEGAPGLCFARYPAVFAIDHDAGRSYIAGDDAAACDRLLGFAGLAADGCKRTGAISCEPRATGRVGPVHAADPAEHARAIARALELIGRGELYQVNLARRLWAPFERPALALALAMRDESPVPLGMFFDDGERALIARTMERFLRWKLPERRLHTRPIKGTTPREDRGSPRDSEEQRALVADPKEHAEHAMIVDLMRNDLGRVAAIGSVEVVERFVVEPFARLHHLVSTVACTTRPEARLSDVLRATFPPGSVTGTPKLRAIEVIDALEAAPRGIYTGAVGFIDRAGGLSLAVAIRTAVVERGVASYFAGGGIVEASDIEREIAETNLKARVFTDAIRKLAERP